MAEINAQGESVLNGILTNTNATNTNATNTNATNTNATNTNATNTNATNTIRHHARFGAIMDIQIPGGQGARFSADGKTFFHFLEP